MHAEHVPSDSECPTARTCVPLQAATGLAGEQAGRILPELLRPRDWHKVPREERRRVRLNYLVLMYDAYAEGQQCCGCPCNTLLLPCGAPRLTTGTACEWHPLLCQCPAPLSALPPQVRQESGINSFADVAKLLEGAPRPLLDTLRLGAVVRHSGAR